MALQKQICSNCGEEDYEHMMWPINTGRVRWLCNECYQAGQREVHYREVEASKKHQKKAEQVKKR